MRFVNTIHGLAWNLAISRCEEDIWGFWPLKMAKIVNFFTPQGRTHCPMLVKSVGLCEYRPNSSTEVVDIWCDSVGKLGIYRHFPQNFRSPLAPKLLVRLTKSRGCKNGTDSIFMQSLVEIRLCMAAWERKVGNFCFLFFMFWILNLNKGLAPQRFSHSNSDIVAICRSILMRISAFFRGRNVLWNIWRHLNCAARCGHICVGIGSKFEFFWKFEGHVRTTSTI